MGPLDEDGVPSDDFDYDNGMAQESMGGADEWLDWADMKKQMGHDEL